MSNSIIRRLLSVIVSIITSFNLAGCNTKLTDEEIGKAMEENLTQLFISVQELDKEAFKTFFADHVVALPDFENGCNYVFERYQGDLISVNFLSAGSSGTHFVPGEKISYAYMTFLVNTSEKEYMACIEFYTQYESKYPDDSYKIRKFSLLTKQDDGEFEDYDGFNLRYGIYYPGWIDKTGDG